MADPGMIDSFVLPLGTADIVVSRAHRVARGMSWLFSMKLWGVRVAKWCFMRVHLVYCPGLPDAEWRKQVKAVGTIGKVRS
jgi:hypothetical protein